MGNSVDTVKIPDLPSYQIPDVGHLLQVGHVSAGPLAVGVDHEPLPVQLISSHLP